MRSSVSGIDAQIEKLRERKRTMILRSADRFARAATKSGLADMEFDQEALGRICEEIALRFRSEEKGGLLPPPLRSVSQQLDGLERRRRFLMAADRKRAVRANTRLGGIVVRAGLSSVDRAFLLGGLLELARIEVGSPEYQRLREIGEKAFQAPPVEGRLRQIGKADE